MKCNMFKDGCQCKRNANHEGACAMECLNYEPDDYEKLFNLMGTLKGEDWTEIIEIFPELKKQIGANHED